MRCCRSCSWWRLKAAFPSGPSQAKNGMLLLRLLFPKMVVLQMYQGLDAALITGVSFIPTQEPTHVMLSTTLPTAHVMTDTAHFSEYKRAHKMGAAIRQSSAANDGLYGFQAVQGQLIVPSTTAPCIFKSAPCARAAISIPLDCFVAIGPVVAISSRLSWKAGAGCRRISKLPIQSPGFGWNLASKQDFLISVEGLMATLPGVCITLLQFLG